MKLNNIKNFTNGWFIGDFVPSLFKQPFFEVAHHHYSKGLVSTPHTHIIAVEVNYIVTGKLIASGNELGTGDIFTYEPGDVSDVQFLEDTDLVIIKYPSVPSDKVLL